MDLFLQLALLALIIFSIREKFASKSKEETEDTCQFCKGDPVYLGTSEIPCPECKGEYRRRR